MNPARKYAVERLDRDFMMWWTLGYTETLEEAQELYDSTVKTGQYHTVLRLVEIKSETNRNNLQSSVQTAISGGEM